MNKENFSPKSPNDCKIIILFYDVSQRKLVNYLDNDISNVKISKFSKTYSRTVHKKHVEKMYQNDNLNYATNNNLIQNVVKEQNNSEKKKIVNVLKNSIKKSKLFQSQFSN